MRYGKATGWVFLGVLLLAAPVAAQDGPSERAGRFDTGKMWTFEYAPAEYFSREYGFDANAAWFDRIRMSVLRIPGCSASFVSPNGLVATNHHCVRGAIARVEQAGETLLDDGFWAGSLEEERRIPDYWADRLIAVQDVSDEVFAALDRAADDDERQRLREQVTASIQQRLVAEQGGGGDVRVQVIPLYDGGRYSAYVFRRLSDVRLVGAVELQAGFFGGDPDNFTYPRYALDFAFLRVYDDSGRPFEVGQYLDWGVDGVREGDVVFVVGNPGPTSRLNTIAQLEYTRDVTAPAIVRAYSTRLGAMRAFYDANRQLGEEMGLRNTMFGLSNSLKAWSGRLDALRDPVIMARKADFERAFADSIRRADELRERFGGVMDNLAALQAERRQLADRFGAFLMLGSGSAGSATLARALAAQAWLDARDEEGLPQDSVDALRQRILAVGDRPPALERALLRIRLEELRDYLGAQAAAPRAALGTRSAADAADVLVRTSVLGDSARTAAALAEGRLDAQDPAVAVAAALLPDYREFNERMRELGARERELQEQLGRARFAVYGTSIPPDATFSPRITDGVVRGYPMNGTIAAPYTTFFGMYDHYYSYGPDTDWRLPPRFLPEPPELDLDTPLNFVSTADTYGGNSGSPAITPQLRLVGLNFDRNIEGLSRDFIYLPERGRNIMVDSRAVLEALDDIYDADRIVAELVTGDLEVADAEGIRR